MKCPQQAHVFQILSLAGGAILSHLGTLVAEVSVEGVDLRDLSVRYTRSPVPVSSPSCPAQVREAKQLCTGPSQTEPLLLYFL